MSLPETRILIGDCRQLLKTIKDNSVHCVVTSPPYWGLRDYGVAGQIGLESDFNLYVQNLTGIFCEVRRVLRADGTCWLNLGDSYAGSWGAQSREHAGKHAGKHAPNVSILSANYVKASAIRESKTGSSSRTPGVKRKEAIGIPWRVAFGLQESGWYLRSPIVWAKPNSMPGSQQDRPTSSYEMLFMMSKSAMYWCDFDAIKTPPKESSRVRLAQNVQAQAGSHRANGGAKTNGPMRAVGVVDKQRGHSRRHAGFNARWDEAEQEGKTIKPAMMRDVWFVSPGGYKEAHFAVMPEEIARRCILAGCPERGIVLDPFGGVGTVGLVAKRLNRHAVLLELNPDYAAMAQRRIDAEPFPATPTPVINPAHPQPLPEP